MRVIKAAVLAGIMAAGGAAGAAAADYENQPDGYGGMGFYVRADAGWSFLDIEGAGANDDDSFVAGGGAGYQITEYLRTDVRFDWAGDYDIAGDVDVASLTGNLYVDIPTGSMIVPYIGAGAGWGWTETSAAIGDDNGFAYALMAGAAVDLTEQFAFDAGYRYRDIILDGNDTHEHQMLGGIRFKF